MSGGVGPFVAPALLWGTVLGTMLGAGLWLLVLMMPRWGTPVLSGRVAPYVRDVAAARGDLELVGVVAPRAPRLVRSRMPSPAATALAQRLRAAGWRMDPTAYRVRRLVWTVGGATAGAVAVVVLALIGRATPGLAVVPILAAGAGAVLWDLGLQRATRARAARIHEELPSVLELLSLSLSAGEGLLDALRRVGDVGSGELCREVRGVTADVATGIALPDALARLAERVPQPGVRRAVDHLIAALERGAPLVQVLQDQAVDAREETRRALIERAGRAEIAMMFPLVFLILPLSVLFAVYPGIVLLRFGIG
ncbi:type II secretion system F family protein [Microbacterium sp. LRZ72]|uniref:type II secretion system F family protein n=1 Tax=Microbacterium sp. LRZ72 TaxID=2942481 RepID=UPI0029A33A9C|nr:type II secretion system F family protein [Microbacterium sp. LRZ72]MDX2377908.1 type II secretion system F family protein [Microbacterium sp. LRZ72]